MQLYLYGKLVKSDHYILIIHTATESDKKVFKEFAHYASYANGLILCDDLSVKGIQDTRWVIWFLNIASAYCDMAIKGKLNEFYYLNHTPRTY